MGSGCLHTRSDLCHRKSAQVLGAPNDNPPRVFPTTPHRHQPRLLDSLRSLPPARLGRGRRRRLTHEPVCGLDVRLAVERGPVGWRASLGRGQHGPGGRSGRSDSWSSCPPWLCCALSGWGRRSGGGDKERRRPPGRQRARPTVSGRLDPVQGTLNSSAALGPGAPCGHAERPSAASDLLHAWSTRTDPRCDRVGSR